jgi:hypothetical protein
MASPSLPAVSQRGCWAGSATARSLMIGGLVLGMGTADGAESDLSERLNLEVHGFVSFGYLRSWGNDWLGETDDGTFEFHETGANFIVRPMERLRIGAQLFSRDLGRYDNGRAELDWAYADYRFADGIGTQVGRYKYPLGLYNEVLDVDAARVAVFLPNSIYALRSRDLYLSADGAKVYGYIPAGEGGFEYVVHAGGKHFDPDGGTVSYFSEVSGSDPDSTAIDADILFGAMVHWHTPIAGLGLRLSFASAHNFEVCTRVSGLESISTVEDYSQYVVSVIYEFGEWELASEYSRIWARNGESTVPAIAYSEPLHDNRFGAYVSLTWHTLPWLDTYAALQVARPDSAHMDAGRADSAVLAARVMPLPNWSIKAEVRHTHGTSGLTPQPDGSEPDSVWQALALKTTVDF